MHQVISLISSCSLVEDVLISEEDLTGTKSRNQLDEPSVTPDTPADHHGNTDITAPQWTSLHLGFCKDINLFTVM